MNRPSFAIWLLTFVSMIIGVRETSACKPSMPTAYDSSAGVTEGSPALIIRDLEIDLGENFGVSGNGDCSDKGSVRIVLSTADGVVLDGKYGVKVNVIAGGIPGTLVLMNHQSVFELMLKR